MSRHVIVEADGGSRGNPGPAAYGAVLRDADSGHVIAESSQSIGRATNNVAEYRGLIAGLELYTEHAPDAELEVRMDSKLVIEQMAGRWKIKHSDMRSLATRAHGLAPLDTRWTWVPREKNAAADRLVNVALDEAEGKTALDDGARGPDALRETPGWRDAAGGRPTTLILLRHGVTDQTVGKVFSGSGGGNPGLNEIGREQALQAADWLARHGSVAAIIASPLTRTRETAGVVATRLGLDVIEDSGIAEASFGQWDGYSFAQVMERWPQELERWLQSSAVAPPGGEAFDDVAQRVEAARDRMLDAHRGQTIVAVSHVTPIKLLVRDALNAPMQVIHRMELAPASVTTINYYPDGVPSLRNFSLPPG